MIENIYNLLWTRIKCISRKHSRTEWKLFTTSYVPIDATCLMLLIFENYNEKLHNMEILYTWYRLWQNQKAEVLQHHFYFIVHNIYLIYKIAGSSSSYLLTYLH